MSKEDYLSDEYVANLLAADAKASTIKYSAMGLEAFASSKYALCVISLITRMLMVNRAPANKPKPNTRFLRNIIKDTDSHNAALLAKEAADAKARLRELGKSERSRSMNGSDVRKRQLGDIASILGGGLRKRRVVEKDDERTTSRKMDVTDGDDSNTAERQRKLERDDRIRHKSSRDHRDDRDGRDRERRHRRRDESRSRSPDKEPKSERRHRERSPRRKRSRSREGRRESSRPQQQFYSTRDKIASKTTSKRASSIPPKEDDSDPLDDIIGPRPPPEVQSRGRGAASTASGIDARFAKGYDPSADVKVDFDDDNDWEQALEALRDRQKWKQQGADRLRAAGFTDEEVKKWEKGGEKREEDVTWAKKGEGREWDRGKFVDDEGVVTFDPSYGRLNDT